MHSSAPVCLALQPPRREFFNGTTAQRLKPVACLVAKCWAIEHLLERRKHHSLQKNILNANILFSQWRLSISLEHPFLLKEA